MPDEPESLSTGADRLHGALAATADQLRALADDTGRRLGQADAGIFRAQGELIADTDLITLACQLMVEGHGVAFAWHAAVERMAAQLSALGNRCSPPGPPTCADVGRRVLAQIDPALRADHALPDTPCILIAPDLAPSDTAGLDPARVIGLATAQGGRPRTPRSWRAPSASRRWSRAAPACWRWRAARPRSSTARRAGSTSTPARRTSPPRRRFATARSGKPRRRRASGSLPARTRDGRSVAAAANVNTPDQVPFALDQGARGRRADGTEFLFLERGETPSEDEQAETYAAMMRALGGKPLIVRALDIGGDKQVAHLNLPREENPFLGVRGARLLLRRPDLIEPQLRALYRSARDLVPAGAPTGKDAPLSIMMPMITSVPEVLAWRETCERIRPRSAPAGAARHHDRGAGGGDPGRRARPPLRLLSRSAPTT